MLNGVRKMPSEANSSWLIEYILLKGICIQGTSGTAVSGSGRLGSSKQISNSWYSNPKSSFAVFVLVTRKSAFIKSILPSFYLNFISYLG